jgi:hypothetical protein
MKWELITMEHYPMLKEWWEGHGWKPVSPDCLSGNGILVIKDEPIFAGWILQTGTSISLFEYVVSNPAAKDRSGGFKYLLSIAETIAKYNGARHLMHMTSNDKLVSMLEDNDWKVTDRGCTHLIKNLWEQ